MWSAPCGALGDALEGREAPLSNHSRTADGAGSAVRISGHLSVRRQQRVSHDGRNAPAVPQTGQNRDTAGGRSRYRLRDGGQYAPDRFYDYTPYPNTNFKNRLDSASVPEQGGAAEFLQFIEEELKPQIESEFNVDRRRQTIFGHSLGGLFTLYAMFSKPQAFSCYIAGDPSIHWNQEYLQELGALCRTRQGRALPCPTAGAGEHERSHVTGNCISASELAERLVLCLRMASEPNSNSLRMRDIFPSPVLISRGLRFALFLKMKEGSPWR